MDEEKRRKNLQVLFGFFEHSLLDKIELKKDKMLRIHYEKQN